MENKPTMFICPICTKSTVIWASIEQFNNLRTCTGHGIRDVERPSRDNSELAADISSILKCVSKLTGHGANLTLKVTLGDKVIVNLVATPSEET